MRPFTNLLVPTDFSPTSEHAAEYAVRLVEGLGADVLLLHVFSFPHDWYYWEVPELDALRDAVEARAQAKLRALAERLTRPGVSIRTDLVISTNVTGAILSAAEREHPDLIVVGMTGWTGERPALGSIAGQVMRRSDRPVLMVSRDAAGWGKRPHVLVPLDLSEASGAALRAALALTSVRDGQVAVVHVVPALPFQSEYLGDEPVEAEDLPNRSQRLRAVERFVQAEAGPDAQIDVHLAEGDVVDETAGCAERERADLVVLGISDQDRVHKAERLALTISCPVVAVPAPTPTIAGLATGSTAPTHGAEVTP